MIISEWGDIFLLSLNAVGRAQTTVTMLRERLSLMTVTPLQNHKKHKHTRAGPYKSACVACLLCTVHFESVSCPGLLGLALEVASVGALLSTAQGPRPMKPLGPEELAVPYRGSTESTSCGKGTWESSKSCRLEDMHFPAPLGLRNMLVFSSFRMVNE